MLMFRTICEHGLIDIHIGSIFRQAIEPKLSLRKGFLIFRQLSSADLNLWILSKQNRAPLVRCIVSVHSSYSTQHVEAYRLVPIHQVGSVTFERYRFGRLLTVQLGYLDKHYRRSASTRIHSIREQSAQVSFWKQVKE